MEAVKQEILSGQLQPGKHVVESEISQRLNISRSSVREGLQRLAAEGIIQIEHNRGARVRQYTRADIHALHQVREVIEGLGAMLAASRIAVTDLGHRLNDINNETALAVENADLKKFLDLNTQFHDTIIEMSGNPFLNSHIAEARTAYFRLLGNAETPPDFRRSLKEHQDIAEAITSGLPQAAEAAMRRHIRSSLTFILSLPHLIRA